MAVMSGNSVLAGHGDGQHTVLYTYSNTGLNRLAYRTELLLSDLGLYRNGSGIVTSNSFIIYVNLASFMNTAYSSVD